MDDLQEQVAELTERMATIADRMAAFGETTREHGRPEAVSGSAGRTRSTGYAADDD